MEIDYNEKRTKTLSVLQHTLIEADLNTDGKNGILEIIEESSHVAAYQFDQGQSKW